MKKVFKISLLIIACFSINNYCLAQSPFNSVPIIPIGNVTIDNQSGNDVQAGFSWENDQCRETNGNLNGFPISTDGWMTSLIGPGSSATAIPFPSMSAGYRIRIRTASNTSCGASNDPWLMVADGFCSSFRQLQDGGCSSMGIGGIQAIYQFNGTNYDLTIIVLP
jgi:hypothetical protein